MIDRALLYLPNSGLSVGSIDIRTGPLSLPSTTAFSQVIRAQERAVLNDLLLTVASQMPIDAFRMAGGRGL